MKKDTAIAKANAQNTSNRQKYGELCNEILVPAYDINKETYVVTTNRQIWNSTHLKAI